MNYVITGGAGHISKPLATNLINAGHSVTVIGRSAENLKELVALGATAAIGSVEDRDFLTRTFAGADAVYTMAPPNYAAPDMKKYIHEVIKNYAVAIEANKIAHVVNLSSVGAHLSEGCGPVTGLHRGEVTLNALSGVNIKHLRPSYFYYNFLGSIGLLKGHGLFGGNYTVSTGNFPVVDPSDIASAATEELLKLDFKGSSYRYIASVETSTDEIASTLGKAIGQPELKWTKFADEQSLAGMIQAGLSADLSANYVEMGRALDSGRMLEDYWNHKPELGKVKLVDFAKAFAAVYAK